MGARIIVTYSVNVQDSSALEQCFLWVKKHGNSISGTEEKLIWGLVESLVEYELDENSQVVGILQCGADSSGFNKDDLESEFGIEVARLYNKVERINDLSASMLTRDNTQLHKTNNDELLRKLLISIVDDVRVVVIGLNCQLLKLKALKDAADPQRKQQARLVQSVFAPLANRLGLWEVKWELEDIAFKYLNPKTYQTLASYLHEKRLSRENYITEFVSDLKGKLGASGFDVEIHGRPKHLYSIWRKMQSKNLEFQQIWDILAVRVICNDIDQCYGVLGVIHANWPNIPSEYKDYIATPKPNGYRSIHTIVKGQSEQSSGNTGKDPINAQGKRNRCRRHIGSIRKKKRIPVKLTTK